MSRSWRRRLGPGTATFAPSVNSSSSRSSPLQPAAGDRRCAAAELPRGYEALIADPDMDLDVIPPPDRSMPSRSPTTAASRVRRSVMYVSTIAVLGPEMLSL